MDQKLHDTLSEVQREQIAWIQHNFPDRTEGHPLIGVVEELGELVSAKSIAETADAIADALIYLSDYATTQKLVLSCCYAEGSGYMIPLTVTPGDLLRTIGKLSHAHLKMSQGIRGTPEEHTAAKITQMGRLVVMLGNYAVQRGLNVEQELRETWTKVKARDWRADPSHGGESITEAGQNA